MLLSAMAGRCLRGSFFSLSILRACSGIQLKISKFLIFLVDFLDTVIKQLDDTEHVFQAMQQG